jgi:hypothetical protein
VTRKHAETAWLVIALVLAIAVKGSWANGHLPNPYVTEAFVAVAGAYAIYQGWRYFQRRSDT